jgi:hypothetical protein
MVESLKKLKIDYKMQQATKQAAFNSNKAETLTEAVKTKGSNTGAAIDNGASIVKELQMQIKENRSLKESLQTT